LNGELLFLAYQIYGVVVLMGNTLDASSARPTGIMRKAAKGAAWLVAARLATKSIDFIALLILARLLTPAAFGIVAIAASVIQIVEAIFELPIAGVLVGITEITNDYLDTAFTLSVMRCGVVALAMAILAIPSAHFFHDSRLIILLPVLSLSAIFRGLSSPRLITYSLRLDYWRNSALDLSGKVCAFTVSTIAAYHFRDYRALVIGTLTTPFVATALSYCLAPYAPRLRLTTWRSFAHYLSWSTISQFLGAISWQLDQVLLGHFVSKAALGEFSLADDLSAVPEQSLIKPILTPLMAAFSLIRSKRQRLELAYAKSTSTVLLIGSPLVISLSILAEPAVHVALGGKWDAAIPVLHWLPLAILPALIAAPLPSLAAALGRPDIMVRKIAIELLFKVPFLFVGARYFGVPGVIVARYLSGFVLLGISCHYVERLIGTPISLQLIRLWRVMLGSAALVITLLLCLPAFQNSPPGVLAPLLLLGVIVLGVLVYGVSLWSLWRMSGSPEGAEAELFLRVQGALRRKSGENSFVGTC
jgi:O-antigen/teichoic acid export membrane protein